MSPTFTSGKLKAMMEPMAEVCEKMIAHIDDLFQKDPIIEIKSVFQGTYADFESNNILVEDTS